MEFIVIFLFSLGGFIFIQQIISAYQMALVSGEKEPLSVSPNPFKDYYALPESDRQWIRHNILLTLPIKENDE